MEFPAIFSEFLNSPNQWASTVMTVPLHNSHRPRIFLDWDRRHIGRNHCAQVRWNGVPQLLLLKGLDVIWSSKINFPCGSLSRATNQHLPRSCKPRKILIGFLKSYLAPISNLPFWAFGNKKLLKGVWQAVRFRSRSAATSWFSVKTFG